jgi:GT2 family glycosyltransferase
LDWCEQIRQGGYGIWYDPMACILHKESTSTGKDSPLKTKFLTRNRIFFMRRNFQGWRLAVFLIFYCCVSFPIHATKLLLKGDFKNLRALVEGTSAGISMN